MKTMTCRQLAGACDKEFHGDTFEDIAQESKKHAMEMYQQGDMAHMEAMGKMKDLMQSPAAMKDWFEQKRMEFDALPG